MRMDIILLCAGYATRLYPLTLDKPKPLLPVGGKPIVEHVLSKLEPVAGDVDKVYAVTNEKFHTHFEKWARTKPFSRPIEVINDKTTTNETRLGAIGDLKLAAKQVVKGKDIFVAAGDNVFTFDLVDFFKEARAHRPSITIGATDVEDKTIASQCGIVKIDKANRVTLFVEKPKEPPSTLASMAVYYFPSESLGTLERYKISGEQDAPGYFISWLVKNEPVYAYPFQGTWFDIGTKKGLEEADKFFKNN